MATQLIGESQNIEDTKALINKISDSGLNVLIQGETGVGKDLVVRNLYMKSERAAKPLIKVNCAAMPDTLLESEMFGYERSAFTGAVSKTRGKFEQAHGGTLFLDEIGDMPLALQSKLLHVLHDGHFTPLGAEKSLQTDARVIAATNHDLEDNMRKGKFRDDLYYRLCTIKIVIDPLRKRPEDIPLLVNYYFKRYASRYKADKTKPLNPLIVDKLCSYHWPGNVRELQSVLKRIIVLEMKETNITAMLSQMLQTSMPHKVNEKAGTRLFQLEPFMPKTSGFPDFSNLSLKAIRKKAGDHIETVFINRVLNKTGWNRSRAARMLQISYKTLLKKIDYLGLEPPADLF